MHDGNGTSPAEILNVVTKASRPFQHLGFEVLDVKAGYLRLAMRVRPEMLGGHGFCEGGYIFSLADLACAFACLTRNEWALTQSANINFIAPAREGERLIANATEISRTKRSGIYDVTVTGEGGKLVAMLRGQFAIQGTPILPVASPGR